MSHDDVVVFIFMSDGSGVSVSPSIHHLDHEVEQVDVQELAYEFVDINGRVYKHHEASATEKIRVFPTARTLTHDELLARLRRASDAEHLEVSDRNNPLAFAQAIADANYARRWPKRPKWLDRRLNGSGPHRYLP